MKTLNSETWKKVYTGKLADVAVILDQRKQPLFQTMSKDGKLTGWRYGDNLEAAKNAADKDGK